MYPYLARIPNLETQPKNPREHHGQEFIYLLDGELEATTYAEDGIAKEVLNAGDSCYLDSTVPHYLRGQSRNPYSERGRGTTDTLEHLPAMKNEAAVIERIRERGIIVVPTLHARRRFAGERWLSPSERELKSQTTPKDYEERFRKMHAAGILMALGTDTGGKDQGQIGEFYTQELKFFLEWGYEPHEVLQAATRIGAEAAGLGDELGTLERGKLADVIVVPGDPLKDIAVANRPTLVIKDGVIARQKSAASKGAVTTQAR